MLLAIDIGNTHTVIGVYAGDSLRAMWRIATNRKAAADELRIVFSTLFFLEELDLRQVRVSAVASVVPQLTRAWMQAIKDATGALSLVCNAETAAGLFDADYPNPREIGADRVVFPEQEMALRLARNLANGDILNFIELSEEYSIMECRCPRQWQGKSIRELDVRARHRLNIIAIRRGGGMTISPGGEYALQEEDELVVLGRNEDIREVERL